MKYTLQIAFSKPVGDILLRVCEYAKKFGRSSADYLNPLRFDFSDTNIIEVQRPEKNCPIGDFALFAMELYNGIPLRWMTNNTTYELRNGRDIEDFFEREFSDHVIEDDDIEPEMHLVFYVPLYEFGIYKHVKYIMENLPQGHKFVVNVIGITYDIAWACRMLDSEMDKSVRGATMLRNIQELKNMTDVDKFDCHTLLRHIFLFQNYNMGGWSQNFTTEKLIDVCANLSLALVEHYDTICHYSWDDFAWEVDDEGKRKKGSKEPRRIYAINLQSRVIDVYLAIDHIFRELFTGIADDHVIDTDEIDKIKVKDAFKKILEREVELIGKYKESFTSGLENQSDYDDIFSSDVKDRLKEIITEIIDTYKLNVSEQQYLYSLFVNINENTEFDDPDLNDAIWQLQEMMLQQLNGDADLLEAFTQLKRCSRELSETNDKIEEIEDTIRDLQSKLITDYPPHGELTDVGYKIGENIYKPDNVQEHPLDEDYEMPDGISLPYSVDLRTFFSPIQDQESQKACNAFSIVAVIEYFIHQIYHNNDNLSESFVYYNTRELANQENENVGTNVYALISSLRDKGVCLEELCPFKPDVYDERPSDEAYADAESRKVTEAKNVALNLDVMRSALAQGYPLLISARAFDAYVQDANGVIEPPPAEELAEDKNKNHAMVICGYTDRDGGYFIVRNSWGVNWCDQGYCYMPYDYVLTPNALNRAYAVTGINVEGFNPGELPKLDTILPGKDVNAQYRIYQNILRSKNRELESNRERLNELRQEYLRLFNQIADYSNVELTLKDLKAKTEEERAELEEQLKQIAIAVEEEKQRKKGFFDRFRKQVDPNERYQADRDRINSKLQDLDHYADDEKRKFRVRLAIMNGLKSINTDCLEESIHRQNLSNYYATQIQRIENQNNTEEYEYQNLKRILPMDEILTHLKASGLLTLMSDLGSTLSRVINGEIGLYETLSDLQSQVINQIAEELNIRIADHLGNEMYESFYKQIRRSSVMAQICGGVPTGYGDETKYFFCNVEAIPKKVQHEVDDVRLLQIKDNLRMCFLHIEKYDVNDFVIFKEAQDAIKNIVDNGESVKDNKEIANYARLAAHAYGDRPNSILPSGCKVIDGIDDPDTGLLAKVYLINKDEIVCAFAGTRGINPDDWIANISQPFGFSGQYRKALEFGNTIIAKYPSQSVTFVGHSKGGGQAAHCALNTGSKAVTFNPAGLGKETQKKGKSEFTRYQDLHAYIFWNDILNSFQDTTQELEDTFEIPISIKANGTIHYINDYEPKGFSFAYYHGMQGILDYFNIQ